MRSFTRIVCLHATQIKNRTSQGGVDRVIVMTVRKNGVREKRPLKSEAMQDKGGGR